MKAGILVSDNNVFLPFRLNPGALDFLKGWVGPKVQSGWGGDTAWPELPDLSQGTQTEEDCLEVLAQCCPSWKVQHSPLS